MYIGFNLGSIILGLTAWTLATMGILCRRHGQTLGVMSFGCCGVSLVLQFCEISRRVSISDYAAIDDTIEGIIYCAIVLVAVTLCLNITAIRRQKSGRK